MNEKRKVDKSFYDLIINELFFGIEMENIDEETGINYIYYVFFRKNSKNKRYLE